MRRDYLETGSRHPVAVWPQPPSPQARLVAGEQEVPKARLGLSTHWDVPVLF